MTERSQLLFGCGLMVAYVLAAWAFLELAPWWLIFMVAGCAIGACVVWLVVFVAFARAWR